MADRFKIRARVQPFDVTGVPDGLQDVRLEELKLLVPMNGTQTVGDLYFEIQRIYSELYTKAGALRIRCLETEDGELLHTSLRISDCFERRAETTVSSRWTVIAKRQAPSQGELEEYRRNVRQFSFDNLSYARPQAPFSQGLAVAAAQEMSASPMRSQLAIRAPIQADPAESIMPSTERDVQNETRGAATEQAPSSPYVVPNSQQASDEVDNSQNIATHNLNDSQVQSKVPLISRTKTPKRSTALEVNNKQDQDATTLAANKTLSSSKPKRSANGTKQAQRKATQNSTQRQNIYDITDVDEQPQNPPEPHKEQSRKNGLPNDQRSTPNPQEIPRDGDSGAQISTGNIRSVEATEGSGENGQTKANRHDNDQATAKLHASLAKERAETQKLVANLPTTPLQRRSQKLTPFFPRSTTKLTSGSTETQVNRNAADTGIELLQTGTLSSQEDRLVGNFAPDRFKEIDRKIMTAHPEEPLPRKKKGKKSGTDNAKVIEADAPRTTSPKNAEIINSAEEEEAEEAEENQRSEPERSPIREHEEVEEISDGEGQVQNGTSIGQVGKQPKATAAKEGKKRGRPSKKAIAERELQSSRNAPADDEKLGDANDPPPKKRGRPVGSTKNKAKTDAPTKNKAKADAPTPKGKEIKKGRHIKKNGEPRKPGSGRKKRDDSTNPNSPTGDANVSTKAKSKQKTLTLMDMETDTEQPKTHSSKETPSKTSLTKRKRKTDSDDIEAKSTKRAKKTSKLVELANDGAMDESEDREAVLSAGNEEVQANGFLEATARSSPHDNRHASAMRSYSRSPAKEVTSSPSQEYDTDTSSDASERETSVDTGASNAGEQHSEHHQSDATSETDPLPGPKTAMNKDSKSRDVLESTAKKVTSSLSKSLGSRNQNQIQSPKLGLTSSSSDPAEAQLQFEDSASAVIPSVSKRVGRPPSSTLSKYTTFSGIHKQKVPTSKIYSQTIRTNPEFDEKMRQAPKNLKTFTDDSSSSSDSESDLENLASKKKATAKVRRS